MNTKFHNSHPCWFPKGGNEHSIKKGERRSPVTEFQNKYFFGEIMVGEKKEFVGDREAIRRASFSYGSRHGIKFSVQKTEAGLIVRRVR